MKVQLIEYPTAKDWQECRRRALVTRKGYDPLKLPPEPTGRWKGKILEARHSPIRRLMYSFAFIDVPTDVVTHLARHGHLQPYIQSNRPDNQDLPRESINRLTPVNGIFDINAEELMVVANKRLCHKAMGDTQKVVGKMCRCAAQVTPEIKPYLVPMCIYNGGFCHEMSSCGMSPKWKEHTSEEES